MSDKSGIAWTDATWNPTTGCTKVSPGCKYCYAKHKAWPRLAAMKTGVYVGRKFEDVQVHPERLDQPLRWTKPRMIFVNSMSDLFHEDIPDQFIVDVFGIMALAYNHTFQVLTKRPERMRRFLQAGDHGILSQFEAIQRLGGIANGAVFQALDRRGRDDIWWQWPLPNVWLGVSVENQETADERIPLLLQTPAAVRWLSCEPLLGPITLDVIENHGDMHDKATRGSYWRPLVGSFTDSPTIGWVVVGGESGPDARPMNISWAVDIRNQCLDAGTPFFMKQGSQANWPDWKDISKWLPCLQAQEYPEGHK